MRTIAYRRRKFFIVPAILVAVAAFSAVTMALWNSLMPVIFNLPVITFWQAMGLLILARLFFGMCRPHNSWPANYHKYKLREKISKMTPEERKEFFKHMRSKYSTWHKECSEEKEHTPGKENYDESE